MKLVAAPEHLFSRWDDPEGKFNGIPDCFNIDASGHGFACHPNDHYKSWPREWTEQEIELDVYLNSQSQEAEIAGFLATRGACLEDNKRTADAFMCFHWAYQLTKDKRYYQEAAKLQHRLEQSRKLLESIDERERMEAHKKPYEPKVKRWVSPRAAAKHAANPNAVNATHGVSCQCFHCNQDRAAAGKPANNNGFPQAPFHSPQFP
jgi:hypothetical protein